MKANENKVLIGTRAILVPYKRDHVDRYHEWMGSEELLEKTASCRLSLEEEYQMQQSWWLDEDKCTFIILDRAAVGSGGEVAAMAGDVNLFFNNLDDKTEAELEVMIAEPSMRGRGLGKEAVLLMMYYGATALSAKKYIVKVGVSNSASISLFANLGFQRTSYSEIFEEATMEFSCQTDAFARQVLSHVGSYIKESIYSEGNNLWLSFLPTTVL